MNSRGDASPRREGQTNLVFIYLDGAGKGVLGSEREQRGKMWGMYNGNGI